MAKNIVAQSWLVEHLNDPQVIIVDCRFELGKPNLGKEMYELDHIPGAVYLDLEKDLSGPKQKHGGRHPLPDVEDLSEKLGDIGIDQHKKVVVYDDQAGAMAARLWFLLKYMGHETVFVLDQGYTKWKENGHPITYAIPTPEQTTFHPKLQAHLLLQMVDVQQLLHNQQSVLIDSRSADRYHGENETIDAVGGHIPGAENQFWKDSLRQDGSWKSQEELEQRFASYLQQQQGQGSEKELIVYCGSGVTACANLIALDEVGLKPKLYLGSWSDWISYPENPIATGEE